MGKDGRAGFKTPKKIGLFFGLVYIINGQCLTKKDYCILALYSLSYGIVLTHKINFLFRVDKSPGLL